MTPENKKPRGIRIPTQRKCHSCGCMTSLQFVECQHCGVRSDAKREPGERLEPRPAPLAQPEPKQCTEQKDAPLAEPGLKPFLEPQDAPYVQPKRRRERKNSLLPGERFVQWHCGTPVVLSFFLPGLGQLYNLQFVKGCSFFLVQNMIISAAIVTGVSMLLAMSVIIQVLCLYDAGRSSMYLALPQKEVGRRASMNMTYLTREKKQTYEVEEDKAEAFSSIHNRRKDEDAKPF